MNASPEQTVWTTLGEVVEPFIEQGAPKATADFCYVDISSINNACKRIVDPKILPTSKAPTRARQHLKPGDVVVSMTRPNLNAVAMVPDDMPSAIASTGFCVLRPIETLPSYLFYLVQAEDFVSAMSMMVQGALYPAVRPKDILNYRFRLPPVSEQLRIVAKIEELFSKLDVGVAQLRNAQMQLKRYRQAVLKEAVTGELTREWREAHKDQLEPASNLLARILKERHENWQAQQLQKMRAQGKHPKNDSWKKKYRAPASPNIAGVEFLPQTWTWTNLEQVSAFDQNALKAGPFGSSLKKSLYVASGYKIYGQEQVLSGNANYGDYYIDEILYRRLKSCAVKPRDLLMSMVGTIGKILILPEDIQPGIINPRLVKISLHEELVDPRYIKIFLSSPGVQSRFSLASHGGTMDILNLTILKGIPVALPPVSEQSAIIDEVERVFSITESVENAIHDTLRRMDSMRQTVLKCAFEGRLVPQDPNDEPPERLLERIRAERAKREAEKQAEAKSNRKRFTKKRPKRTERPAA